MLLQLAVVEGNLFPVSLDFECREAVKMMVSVKCSLVYFLLFVCLFVWIVPEASARRAYRRVSMVLTVNRQKVKKVTVNRQIWKILTVNRRLDQEWLTVKRLLSRTIIASDNGVKSTIRSDIPK